MSWTAFVIVYLPIITAVMVAVVIGLTVYTIQLVMERDDQIDELEQRVSEMEMAMRFRTSEKGQKKDENG
jgi:mannitol-specific phosphotransferase system IIBC component